MSGKRGRKKKRSKISEAEFVDRHPEFQYVLSELEKAKKVARHHRAATTISTRLLTSKEQVKSTPEPPTRDTSIHLGKKTYLDDDIAQSCSPGPKYDLSSTLEGSKGSKASIFTTAKRFEYHSNPDKSRKKRQCTNLSKSDEKEVNAGIYMLKNVVTGHCFFGSTWDLKNAKAQNLQELENGQHENQAMIRTVQVYGPKDIRFNVLERIATEKEFNFREFEDALENRLVYHTNKCIKKQAFKVLRTWRVNICLQYWPRWKSLTQDMALEEHEAAALEIQRVAKGRRGRKRAIRFRRYFAARSIQTLCRGILARRRVTERRHYVRATKAANTIQKFWKGALDRILLNQRREMIRKCASVSRIERVWMGHKGRQQARAIRYQRLTTECSVEIQRIGRGYLARQAVDRIKQRRREYRAAVEIQRIFRGKLSVPIYRRKREQRDHEMRQEAAAYVIQTYYRYYLGRKLRYTVNRYGIEMHMATVIRTAWRDYIAHKFGWAAIRYKLEHDMVNRLQRMYRFWKTRKTIRQHLRSLKENFKANEIQRVYRGHLGRQRVKRILHELLKRDSAIKIQKAWKLYSARKIIRLAKRHRIHSDAATKIQARYRSFAQRRRYLIMLDEHYRNIATLRIQCQYRIHLSRKKLRRKLWLHRNGPCEKCDDELAEVYTVDFEMELCTACFDEIVAIEREFDQEQYESDDSTEYKPRDFHSMPIGLFRAQTTEAIRIQMAYRRKQLRFLFKYGRCHECTKPQKVYCYDCNLKLCYTCNFSLHSHGSFRHHKWINSETFIQHNIQATIIQKYVRRYFQRHTIRDLNLKRQNAAAKYIQDHWKYRHSRYTAFVKRQAMKARAELEHVEATRIQRWTKGWITRFLVRRRLLEHKSAIRIQSHIRAMFARIELKKRQYEKEQRRRNRAARKIQTMIRVWLACILMERLRELKLRNDAASVIQRAYRSCSAWRELKRRKKERDDLLRLAALKIAQQNEEHSARVIQKRYRERIERKKELLRRRAFTKKRRLMEQHKAEFVERSAARRIQKMQRRRLHQLNEATIRVQSIMRRHLAQRRIIRLRTELVIQKQQNEAATKIQCLFRRRKAIRKVQQLREEYAATQQQWPMESNWIECWDEASQAYYFYNSETQESRWDRPEEEEEYKDEVFEEEETSVWIECWDENAGSSYYYNSQSGESSWIQPSSKFKSMYNYESVEENIEEYVDEYAEYVDGYVEQPAEYDYLIDGYVEEIEENINDYYGYEDDEFYDAQG